MTGHWRNHVERAGLLRGILLVLMCCNFALNYIAVRSLYPLSEFAAGRSDVPFRLLTMAYLRGAEELAARTHLGDMLPRRLQSVDSIALGALVLVSLLLASWCVVGICRALQVRREIAGWAGLLVPLMSFFNLEQSWGLNYTIPYDVPALAFIAACVLLAVRGQFVWFAVVFALSTLNRETSCFLLVFLAVWNWDSARTTSRGRLVLLGRLALLTGLWWLVKMVPTHYFHGHPFSTVGTGPVTTRVLFNLREMLKPQQWPVLASTCAFSLPVLFVFRRFIGHVRFRRAALATMAVWFVGILTEGLVLELRVFAEWVAFVAPLCALVLDALLPRSDAARPAASEPRSLPNLYAQDRAA